MIFPAWVCIVLVGGGCSQMRLLGRKPASQKAAPEADPAANVEKLQEETRRLEGVNRTLEARIEELKGREKTLADKLLELQFLDEQKQKRIEALVDAVDERDRHKARIEALDAELRALKMEIAELKKLLEVLAPVPDAVTTGPGRG